MLSAKKIVFTVACTAVLAQAQDEFDIDDDDFFYQDLYATPQNSSTKQGGLLNNMGLNKLLTTEQLLQATQAEFTEYQIQFGKTYRTQFDRTDRQLNWLGTKSQCDQYNSQGYASVCGMNQFSDWSEDEISNFLTLRPDQDVLEFTKDNIPEGVNFIGDETERDWFWKKWMEKRLTKYTKQYNSLREKGKDLYPQDVQFEEAFLLEKKNFESYLMFKKRIQKADMTDKEFDDFWAQQLRVRDGIHKEMMYRKGDDDSDDDDDSIDKVCKTTDASCSWEEYVLPVKNQGGCGSCWAFAANAVLEPKFAMLHGVKANFSEQQSVDCVSESYGCSGGWMSHVFDYAKKQPLVETSAYPYKARDQTCKDSQANSVHKLQTTKTTAVQSKSAMALKTALLEGPVTIALQARGVFMSYNGGILGAECTYANVDHGVTVIGWGTDPQQGEYVTVRNSWGQGWGEQGYVRMALDDDINNGYGPCGMFSYVMTASVM